MNDRILFYVLIALLPGAISCSSSIEEEIQSGLLNENVYVSVSGAITAMFADEDTDLHYTERNLKPCYHKNEMMISVGLNPEFNLDLILYNAAFTDPIYQSSAYSAYPHHDITDKSSYVIAQLMKDNEMIYTTTFEYAPAIIQPKVFEMTHKDGEIYTIRLRELTMFDYFTDADDSETRDPNGNSIVLNGTFKMHYRQPS